MPPEDYYAKEYEIPSSIEPCCSFCGRSGVEIAHGKAAGICVSCVQLCVSLFARRGKKKTTTLRSIK